jgi:hypothetical protein
MNFAQRRTKMGSSRQFDPEEEGRPDRSEEFLISREALDAITEACVNGTEAHGDEFYAVILEQIETALGNLGDKYNGY